eukprot:CAMPEP_0198506130 /NCGR_PEP_ID=MMETSP1462-20131121/11491_1 /TAXON_ID=1333877 /ORGANISM="Brandtodinium nutriculum, Strain RCC3387" /LENGTH=82 /DNA_ID=CAMNT_0044235339 /DNA_START=36 /DNA_END=280 /DNA_ORIENTATION=-
MAPLEDDMRLTRFVLALEMALFAFRRVVVAIDLLDGQWSTLDHPARWLFSSFFLRGLVFVVCAAWAAAQRNVKDMQWWMWRS